VISAAILSQPYRMREGIDQAGKSAYRLAIAA